LTSSRTGKMCPNYFKEDVSQSSWAQKDEFEEG